MTNFLQSFNDEMADIVHDVRQSIVQIHHHDGSIGAGTIWHTDGMIVTNAHVVVDPRYGVRKDLNIIFADGEQLPATVLAHDAKRDLAVLSVNAENLPTIEIGDSRKVQAGDWVMALGHPWGILDSLTAGIVIGLGTNLPEQDGRDWIALSLKLRPGHSGGALLNSQGEVIGINTMISGPKVGFAIPVQIVKTFLKEVFEEQHIATQVASYQQPKDKDETLIV
jgi:serine protease Do